MKANHNRFLWAAFSFSAMLCAIGMVVASSLPLCPERTSPLGDRTMSHGSSLPHFPSWSATGPHESFEDPQATVPIELVIVPSEEEWLLSIAVPLVAKLRHGERVPVLIAPAAMPTQQTVDLVTRLAPRRSLILATSPHHSFALQLEGIAVDLISTGSQPMSAGFQVAERFWGTSDKLIAASLEDPAAVILGSVLAAHLAIPFIPLTNTGERERLCESLAALGARHVLVAVSNPDSAPLWFGDLAEGARFLDVSAIHRLLLEHLGTQNVRNVILARTPLDASSEGQASWLAPYLSLVRCAPVVLTHSSHGEGAEDKMFAFLRTHSLKPRSVTILGDYSAVGLIDLKDSGTLGEYEIAVEPCSAPFPGGAASLAVGRIPWGSLEEASVLIARGIIRDRLLDDTSARVLMVANPDTVYTSLPLCETISRATAEEFKSFGMKVDEFYCKPSNEPAISDAARQADLIVYEGHISDQRLFEDPFMSHEPGSTHTSDDWEGSWGESSGPYPINAGAECEPMQVSHPESFGEDAQLTETTDADPYHEMPASKETPWGESATAGLSHRPRSTETPQLDRFPLLVFQSCHSLEGWLAQGVFQSGGVGIIGSVTNIHSASGSAFVKAFCDGMLYRGDTVGEALRDARNYFFCLAQLKSKRGHKEQTKVYRVALSFHLWGDPEVRILHRSLGNRKRLPVCVRWAGRDQILISAPALRLPEQRSEKYFVRMFPGDELAGIVRRQKNMPLRRLTPFHFFRLPIPEGFDVGECTDLRRRGDTSPRATFLVDLFHRYLYVLYFPQRSGRGEEFALDLIREVPVLGALLRTLEREDRETETVSDMDRDPTCPVGRNVCCDSSPNQAPPSSGIRRCLASDV